MMKIIFLVLLYASSLTGYQLFAQNTSVLYLNEKEQQRLRKLYKEDPQVKLMCDSVIKKAAIHLKENPKPLDVLFYEGMLESDTARIRTRASLYDMDKVSTMFYASYCNSNKSYGKKIKEFVLSWARKYKPTGNTINENKFIPLFWGYYLFKPEFSGSEQKLVEEWIKSLAEHQLARTYTPNNNWQAKRLRLIGFAGGITGNQSYIDYSINHLKAFVGSAYFADGTSNDLRKRDALHYHVGGLKVLLTIFINQSSFDEKFNLFDYTASNGASIRKSVLYTLPYATGKKVHKEWVNTTVQLDKERAAAGLAEYQPGILYDKDHADQMFEFAVYYNPDWFVVLDERDDPRYTTSWVGLLNSPLIR